MNYFVCPICENPIPMNQLKKYTDHFHKCHPELKEMPSFVCENMSQSESESDDVGTRNSKKLISFCSMILK